MEKIGSLFRQPEIHCPTTSRGGGGRDKSSQSGEFSFAMDSPFDGNIVFGPT